MGGNDTMMMMMNPPALFLKGLLLLMLMACVTAQIKSHLIVTSIIEKPYLFEYDGHDADNKTGNDRYLGFIKELLDELTRRVGVTYDLRVREDGVYGSMFPNHSWNGLIGELIRQEADMAATSLTVTEMRARVVNFGLPFQSFGRVAIVKQLPKLLPTPNPTLEVRLGRLFAPLDDSIWLLSGMAWFVSSLVLYIICRINPYEWRRMVKDREATLREGESFNCANAYWFMLAAAFWQGFMRSPRSTGARIIVTFWWLYSLIFVAMYIASLTNFLMVGPKTSIPQNFTAIQSLYNVVGNDKIKIGAVKHGATAEVLKHSQFTMYGDLWRKIQKDNTFQNSLMEGIEIVRQSSWREPYVFLGESTMSEYHVRQPPCDLYTIRDLPHTGFYAFAYPIGSPWPTDMNLALLAMKEDERLSALEAKWFYKGQCSGQYVDQSKDESDARYPPFQKVDLASFSGALILLMIGLALGTLVTFVEYFIFKYAEKDYHDRAREKHLLKDQSQNNPHQSPNQSQAMTDV